jgi:carbon-monoxide dehydrogenase medium subunit
MKPAPFDYVAPEDLDEAIGALATAGDDAKVLAGGQSLIPMLALRLARPAVLVDINRLRGLDGIREASGMLEIGALVRQRALERWAAGRSPLFGAVLAAVAHPPIRNRGTVVGNVVHADPASELPALLLCLEGVVVARGPRGERMIPADRFYRAPLTTVLDGHELATAVRFALPPAGAGWGFAEVSRRHGDFALVGAVAVLAAASDGTVGRARLAFFGAGGTPVRGAAAERTLEGRVATPALIGEAARAAAAGLSPDGDIHATAEYRRRVAATLAERTLTAALARCGGRS